MAGTIKNFQYIGYLSDFITTHYNIDVLIDKFSCAKYNYDNINNAKKVYSNTFSFKNCIIGWIMIFACTLITFPLLFLPGATVFPWLVFCAILSSVIIVASKIVYKRKVLPIHFRHLKSEEVKSKRMYEVAYKALLIQRDNLYGMQEGIDEECTYPLSLYIMLKAAKQGDCANIPQGIKYFQSKYKALSSMENEDFTKLKENIDAEQSRAANVQQFLNNIDNHAQSLFDK